MTKMVFIIYRKIVFHSMYCLKCNGNNNAFSSLNQNQFNLSVTNGINFKEGNEITVEPSSSERFFLVNLNRASTNLEEGEDQPRKTHNVSQIIQSC